MYTYYFVSRHKVIISDTVELEISRLPEELISISDTNYVTPLLTEINFVAFRCNKSNKIKCYYNYNCKYGKATTTIESTTWK